jgi:hypothetical protein
MDKEDYSQDSVDKSKKQFSFNNVVLNESIGNDAIGDGYPIVSTEINVGSDENLQSNYLFNFRYYEFIVLYKSEL